MSGGAGFADALEVKPNSGADPQGAASASSDPKPDGDAADGDRKALNIAKEALKKSGNLEGQMSQLSNLVIQSLQRDNGAPAPAAPVEDKVTAESLREALAGGDTDVFVERLNELVKQTGQQATDRAVDQTEKNTQTRDFRKRLVQNLNLTDPNREENRQIFAAADQMRIEYPALQNDVATSQLAASAEYWKGVAMGQIDPPDSLRAERLDRKTEPAGGDVAGDAPPAETTIEPDWGARNRGLPADMVKQLEAWDMGHLLTKTSDPHLEMVARETILGFLDDGNHGG